MIFKKKEKPILKENIFDVCQKAIYTDKKGYVPTEFVTYEDRIEITVNVCDEESYKACKATASTKGERLAPIELDGEQMYFDIKDKALRIKPEPEGEGIPLIPQVIIYSNKVMKMEKEFAKKYYSDAALSYATEREDGYYWFYPDGSATPVVFETPRLFIPFLNEPLKEEQVEKNEIIAEKNMLSPDRLSLHSNLPIFTCTYLEEMGIKEEDFLDIYTKNAEKQ